MFFFFSSHYGDTYENICYNPEVVKEAGKQKIKQSYQVVFGCG